MNRPDRASEPSMDEILASIRRIIAEEPTAAEATSRPSEPVVTPLPSNPLLRPTQPVPGQPPQPPKLRETLPLPSFDRITDALRNPVPASAKLTAPRAGRDYATSAPHDEDLADLLREPVEAGERASGPAVQAGPSEAQSSGAISAVAEAAAATEEKPPIDETWAVWRQTTTPPADASPPFGTLGMMRRGSGLRGAPSVPPISGIMAAASKPNGSSHSDPAPAIPNAPSSSGPVIIAAMPTAQHKASPAPATEANDPPIADARSGQDPGSVLLPPRQIAMAAVPAQDLAADQKFADDAAAMAASALELLGAGSAAGAPPAPSFAASIAAARVAVATHNQQNDGAAMSGTALAVPSQNGQPVRSLEDAVAEMLRPMLQQWLTDHMPRIIERALRIETAPSVKDGSQ